MCDILNEPDFGNLRWEAANGLPGMGDLYLQAMDALYAANPGLLFFVEGERIFFKVLLKAHAAMAWHLQTINSPTPFCFEQERL